MSYAKCGATSPSGPRLPQRHLHSSAIPAHLFQPDIPTNCKASLWTNSTNLDLAFPAVPVLENFALKILF